MTGPDWSGMLVIDKPAGATSMDVCRWVRSRLRAGGAPGKIRVGHGGTLDPLATGVLVVLVGRATKRCEEVMAGEKEYVAQVDLARRSTTDDLEGEIEEVPVFRPPDASEVERVVASMTGRIMQRPPAFSAVKVRGQRAYRAARAGRALELSPRPVVVHSIRIVRYVFPELVLDVRCGKGTYIRSLARDIGAALGVGGMLTGLRRTAVGPYRIESAVSMDALPQRLTPADLIPIERGRSG